MAEAPPVDQYDLMVIDEHRDAARDRLAHPERLLSRGVVTLRDPYGVVHIIPNGQIGVVSNLTRGWARAVVAIGVPWGTDIDRALSVFRDEAARFAADPAWQRRLDGEPEVLGVESMTHAQMVIRTLIRTVPGEQAAAAREFRRRMKIRIDREALKVS